MLNTEPKLVITRDYELIGKHVSLTAEAGNSMLHLSEKMGPGDYGNPVFRLTKDQMITLQAILTDALKLVQTAESTVLG
jgi:hypothetical protein